jgi:hypothetical protein
VPRFVPFSRAPFASFPALRSDKAGFPEPRYSLPTIRWMIDHIEMMGAASMTFEGGTRHRTCDGQPVHVGDRRKRMATRD